MKKIKVEDSVIDYTYLTDVQLHEQLRVQNVRLNHTSVNSFNLSESDILHNIFLNLKYINTELKKRRFNRT
ncbi:hypothetical protein [Maribacter sp. ACAM166]|uniref:hypothetical protein n=1 Tax=Maribacter sp. ACAM166 TaxID=2508996 RepID=UPI0010FCEBE8|nr:hypothetical protein [Maribacter sp. ACAM166]TLP75696.1 hypothetical protein ES765_14745 [Maribacter sp. ACAM166]